MNTMSIDSIVTICADFYSLSEVETARNILAQHVSTTRRLPKHTGTDEARRRKTVQDMVKLCLDPSVALPTFCSLDMARVPAVGLQHFDVSALLQEESALRAEVRSFAAIRSEISMIRESVKEVHMTEVQHAIRDYPYTGHEIRQ